MCVHYGDAPADANTCNHAAAPTQDEDILAELAFLLVETPSPRTRVALARVVAGLAPHLHTSNDRPVLDSGLLGSLIVAINQGSVGGARRHACHRCFSACKGVVPGARQVHGGHSPRLSGWEGWVEGRQWRPSWHQYVLQPPRAGCPCLPPQVREGAVCALVALQLAVATPDLFAAAMRRADPDEDGEGEEEEEEEEEPLDEGDEDYYEEDDVDEDGNPRPKKQQQGRSKQKKGEEGLGKDRSLYGALAKLYARAIDPSLPPAALPTPAEAAQLLMRALSLEPWTKSPNLGKGPAQKVMMRRAVESGACACLVSYVVLEASAWQRALADAASEAAGILVGWGS